MIPVQDLFEAHLTVTDLDRAIAFYRDAVGLRLAHVTSARQAAFFWIGPAGNAMLGLWAAGPGPQRMTLHTASTRASQMSSQPRAPCGLRGSRRSTSTGSRQTKVHDCSPSCLQGRYDCHGTRACKCPTVRILPRPAFGAHPGGCPFPRFSIPRIARSGCSIPAPAARPARRPPPSSSAAVRR